MNLEEGKLEKTFAALSCDYKEAKHAWMMSLLFPAIFNSRQIELTLTPFSTKSVNNTVDSLPYYNVLRVL
jgi:hypothetical protein